MLRAPFKLPFHRLNARSSSLSTPTFSQVQEKRQLQMSKTSSWLRLMGPSLLMWATPRQESSAKQLGTGLCMLKRAIR